MSDWEYLKKVYKIKEHIGQGSYGQVHKATNRLTKQVVAIKYIKGFMKNSDHAKMVVRELTILRKLSKIKKNIFTTKLLDVVLAGEPDKFESIFLVMEYVDQDLA